MGFLKKFFQTKKPAIIELVTESQPKQPEMSALSFPMEHLLEEKQRKSNILMPDERITAIELQAFAIGWTWEQFWKESKRYDQKGLASVIQLGQSITVITPQYIQLERNSSTGKLEIQRFYNYKTHQPWLKRSSPDQSLRTSEAECKGQAKNAPHPFGF